MSIFSKSVAAMALVLVALSAAWGAFEYRWYASIIPAEIGISHSVEISGQSGIREGCGAAIFRMDEATAARIAREGMGFLAGARQSRGHDDAYHRFEEWKPTPVRRRPGASAGESALFAALGCSDADTGLRSDIRRSLEAPGSYYADGPEKVLLLVPDKRLIVLTYLG